VTYESDEDGKDDKGVAVEPLEHGGRYNTNYESHCPVKYRACTHSLVVHNLRHVQPRDGAGSELKERHEENREDQLDVTPGGVFGSISELVHLLGGNSHDTENYAHQKVCPEHQGASTEFGKQENSTSSCQEVHSHDVHVSNVGGDASS